MKSIKLITLLSLIFGTGSTLANIKLECQQALGNSVYKSFSLEIEHDGSYWDGYELTDLEGAKVTLDGQMNPYHDDNDDLGEEWTFVTLGERVTKVRDINYGYDFYIETCEHCDFNGAGYEYKQSGEGEIFITEMYNSDGSAEFSVYSCIEK